MIQHVTRQIPPSTLDQCIDFYSQLGFAVVEPPPGIAGRATWLERAADGHRSQFHLMPAPDAAPERGHVGVVVEDYEEIVARLRAAGFEVEPRREHWGSPRAYVRDPAGNIVELMAWAPRDTPRMGTT